MSDIYSISRNQMKKTAEEEILATWTQIDEQDKKWVIEVRKIIKQLNLPHYPNRTHFCITGNKSLYGEISDFASHEYVANMLELETEHQYIIREGIYDIMFKCNINFYPNDTHFRYAKKLAIKKLIEKTSSHENERNRLKLKLQGEYEKIIGRKWNPR